MTANSLQANGSAVISRVFDTLWFNALWFQAVWFCAVLGRDSLLPVAFALLAAHLWLVRDYRRELQLLFLVGGVGIVTDALLSLAGVFEFAGGVLVPLWLCALWLAFGAALGRSLGWLARRPMVAGIAGAVAFPLNYWAGQKLGAVEFGYPLPLTLGLLAVTWAILLPQMCRLTTHLARSGSGGAA